MSTFKKIASYFSLRRALYNKKFCILLSIILAFSFWLLIVTKENPIIRRSFPEMTVNINLENTIASENGMSLIGDISEQKFTVIARGPTYLVSALKAEDFNVYASAASVDAPGKYKLDVTAAPVSQNSGFEILSVTPSTVKVTFDYIDTKEFTVKAIAEGVTAKEGLIAENAVVSGGETDTITITGPRTVINQITSVVAYTKVDKTLNVSETFDADIKLYNEKEKELPLDNLTLSQTKAKVTVPISKKKTVPVEVSFLDLPKGFKKSSLDYTVDFKEVTIIGKPEDVEKTEKIYLSDIEISRITRQTNSFDVSAKLPDGVRLLDNIEHFTVKFNTSGYIERTVDVSKFEFTNLDKSTSAKCSKINNVKLFGPRRAINNLKSKNVYALVNLANKKKGEHTVPVLICFKEDDNVWAIGTYDTTVTIK
jgi:YbbR domain-containing protein